MPGSGAETGLRRAVAALVVACAVLPGCGRSMEVVCPAVGWLNAVAVRLADGWPAVPGGSVRLECSSPCSPTGDRGTVLSAPLSARLSAGAADLQLDMTTPGSALVTVLGADGTELAEVASDLQWVRVGGSAECGGPMQATVTVAAP